MKKLLFSVIFAAALLLTSCSYSKSNSSTFTLFQTANSSSGSYWEYTLSTNEVIKEIEYSRSTSIGPGYKQYWTFEIIGEGEVTINWLAYEGDSYSEKNSYSVTYYIDENGKRQIIE